MKKVISLLLICMMMLSMATVVSAEGERIFTISTSTTSVAAGDTVSVTIDVDNMQSAAGLRFLVAYDPDVFFVDQTATSVMNSRPKCIDTTWVGSLANEETYIGAVWGGLKPNYTFPTSETSAGQASGLIGGEAGVAFVYSATAGADVEISQCVGKFSMTVKDGVPAGNTTLRISFCEMNDVNASIISSVASADVIVSIDGVIPTYAATKADSIANGDITLAAPQGKTLDQLEAGDVVTVTVAPNADYVFGGLTGVENATKVDDTTYTFVMSGENVTVGATFTAIPKYDVTVDAGIQNGTVTVDKAEAKEGETVTVTATAYEHYVLTGITVNGGDVAVDGNTFVMPDEDVTVSATFEAVIYDVTIAEYENGSVIATPVEGPNGTEITLNIEANTGYEIGTVTVVGQGGEKSVVDNKFTLDEDVTVTVTFVLVDYTITPPEAGNYEIADLPATANYEVPITFTVTPDTGYDVAVSIEGVEVDKDGNDYTFTMPANNIEVNVVATAIDYNITVSADENATITVNATANYNETVTFTASALTGFVIDTVTVNDGDVALAEEGGVYSFTMPECDVVIKATTKINPLMDTRIASITVNNQNATINGTEAVVALNVYAQTAEINVVTVEENATVEINGVANKTVTEDVYVGDTTFTIVVTAEDTETTETYTLKVTTPEEYITPSRPTGATGGATAPTLSDVKNNVSAKLDSAAEDLNKEDYSEEAWAEIEKLIEDAKADLENAKNVKAAEKIEKELLEAIEAVKTIDEEEPAEDVEIPVDEELEPAVIAAPEKSEEEIAAAEALYSDMEDHWALAYIHELSVANSVFKGNEDGTFAPDKGITRQEIAVALGRLLGLEEIAAEVTATDFTDDAEIADWAKGYVAVMNELGLLKGNADGSFAANDVITREQLALILSRMVEAPEAVAGMAFDDAEGISDWAADGCAIAYTFGIVKGYPDNTFKGANTVTRAEAVVMIYNYLAAIAD